MPAAEKLEEQTMIQVEEALVWITQCKKDAGKALSKELKGAPPALIKGNLKDKVSELINMQSKMEEIKIFGMGDFSYGKNPTYKRGQMSFGCIL